MQMWQYTDRQAITKTIHDNMRKQQTPNKYRKTRYRKKYFSTPKHRTMTNKRNKNTDRETKHNTYKEGYNYRKTEIWDIER